MTPAFANLPNAAPAPACGSYADGFAPVARQFAAQLRDGSEIGAGACVFQRGRCVVDLWGGLADAESRRPWENDTRIVIFSATKGLAAIALNMLADRGKLAWDEPVASYWPAFAWAGKANITVRMLLNHRAGLLALDTRLTLDDWVRGDRADVVRRALEDQRPVWEPGTTQGYHALTFGMYASALFEIVAGESIGTFLRRELLEPLGSDAYLGTPESEDGRVARLYPLDVRERNRGLLRAALRGGSTETRVAVAIARRGSLLRRAFGNPRGKKSDAPALEYNEPPVRRAELAWASATASARGLARAYLPLASGGRFDGREYLRASALEPLYAPQSWSERDLVLNKPIGFSQGFVKEQPHVFSPSAEAFGHPGMGGALGWCDPTRELAIGYVMNRMDWRVRSPRALALCKALYECESVREAGR